MAPYRTATLFYTQRSVHAEKAERAPRIRLFKHHASLNHVSRKSIGIHVKRNFTARSERQHSQPSRRNNRAMVDMFVLRNLLQPLSNDKPDPVNSWSMSAPNTMPFGMGVSYVGLLDPVEIYRNWQRKKRALRTKMVLMTLFGNTTRPLTKHETDSIKRSIEWKRNVPVSTIANPVQISTLLKNDTIVEPSKPKFTAPLFGKERPQMAIDTISAASSPKINEIR